VRQRKRRIFDLEAGECRYPITDKPPHLFCGRRAVEDCPYCPHHRALCYAGKDDRGMDRLKSEVDSINPAAVDYSARIEDAAE